MLTTKIMLYCMNHLLDKLEEEKLECLCKLLTTIGERVEQEVRELDGVFKKMQDIVGRKNNKISSRVRRVPDPSLYSKHTVLVFLSTYRVNQVRRQLLRRPLRWM